MAELGQSSSGNTYTTTARPTMNAYTPNCVNHQMNALTSIDHVTAS